MRSQRRPKQEKEIKFMNNKNMKTLRRLTGNGAFSQIKPPMKKKSTSQSAFFNVRVLIGLFVFLASVFPALVVRANPPVIETIPPHPGPPWYANFSADFIPTDDGMVGIAFIREPSCIPTDFNLLLLFDVPAAWGCELTVEGKLWWYDPETDPFPFQERYYGLGAVPIYFVDEAELAAATQDGVLTIGELQALPSLLIGFADNYLDVVHNSNQGGAGKGHEVLNASGTILQSGLPFYFHYTEEFDPDTGAHTLRVRIDIG
jgi:hypothetical protein